jgi:hypothetical protein
LDVVSTNLQGMSVVKEVYRVVLQLLSYVNGKLCDDNRPLKHVSTSLYRVILHGVNIRVAIYRIYHSIPFEEVVLFQDVWMQNSTCIIMIAE